MPKPKKITRKYRDTSITVRLTDKQFELLNLLKNRSEIIRTALDGYLKRNKNKLLKKKELTEIENNGRLKK